MNNNVENYRAAKIARLKAKQYRDLLETYEQLGIKTPSNSFENAVKQAADAKVELEKAKANMSYIDYAKFNICRQMTEKEIDEIANLHTCIKPKECK